MSTCNIQKRYGFQKVADAVSLAKSQGKRAHISASEVQKIIEAANEPVHTICQGKDVFMTKVSEPLNKVTPQEVLEVAGLVRSIRDEELNAAPGVLVRLEQFLAAQVQTSIDKEFQNECEKANPDNCFQEQGKQGETEKVWLSDHYDSIFVRQQGMYDPGYKILIPKDQFKNELPMYINVFHYSGRGNYDKIALYPGSAP